VRFLDLNIVSPAEQLACDEVLLQHLEDGGGEPTLRLWEPASVFVVVGWTNDPAREVHLDACRAKNIPVYRRRSGGGAVVQSPGCLNFSLILRHDAHPELRTAGDAGTFIMTKNASALQPLLRETIAVSGFSDLTIEGRKFAGSAQRRLIRSLLFHGCFLLNCDLTLIDALLPMPSRQPGYRMNRPHGDFVRTVGISAADVISTLREAWGASETRTDSIASEIAHTAHEKYRPL
jgi:lipoate-protein ligase A